MFKLIGEDGTWSPVLEFIVSFLIICMCVGFMCTLMIVIEKTY